MLIGVMGESGAGKTTSLRKLDPKTTMIIDSDKKGLNWKGWREQYNIKNANYYVSNVPSEVRKMCRRVNKEEKFKNIKTIVIDTLNGIMVADEMRRAKETGYDKWVDLAACVWDLIDEAQEFRSDLTVIFMCHTQTERDDQGNNVFTKIKTNGKRLDKISIESKLNIVLYAKQVEGKFVFETHANNSTAKTPLGAFEQDTVENDMTIVLKALEDYK